MKHIYLFIICLFGMQFTNAQDKGTIGVLVGYNQPILDFGKTDLVAYSMFANPGLSYELSGNYNLTKHIGIAALYRFQKNDFDANYFRDSLMKEAPTGYNLSINHQVYTIHSMMLGLHTSFPISNQLSIDSKALLGMALFESFNIDLSADYLGKPVGGATHTFSKSTGLAAMISSGLNYKINERLSVLANASIWMNKYATDINSKYKISGDNSSRSISDYIWTLNYNLGVGYNF